MKVEYFTIYRTKISAPAVYIPFAWYDVLSEQNIFLTMANDNFNYRHWYYFLKIEEN